MRSKTIKVKTKFFKYELYQDQELWWKVPLKVHGGFFQPENLAAILSHVKKRKLSIDIGSHMGMNSMAYSLIFDHVVAFEPQARLYRQSLKHFRMNKIKNVKVYNLALGDRSEIRGLTCQPFQDPKLGNDGMYRITSRRKNVTKVKVRTLDSFGLSPDFIKIDVEGFEKFVLKGATETIRRSRPILLIETIWFPSYQKEFKELNAIESYREEDYEIVRYLKQFGYEPFLPNKKLIHLKTKREFQTKRRIDTLFLPVKKIKS